jgi:hypothetical protein
VSQFCFVSIYEIFAICGLGARELPAHLKAWGPLAPCPAAFQFHVGNSRSRRKARAHLLANFTSLTHNLLGW